MARTVEELYQKYQTLLEATDVSQFPNEYAECIEGTKGDVKAKQLAAQVITKFFKHFPDLQEQAINAMLDLCEDDDQQTRIYTMNSLPLLCKAKKEEVVRIADILAQLLQLDNQEYNTACNCLLQVFKENPTITVKAIFNQVHNSTEDIVREKCVKFLFEKLVKVPDKITSELEDIIIEESKKTLQDCSAEEFITIMPYLSLSKLVKTTAGQQELVNLVVERAELDRDFDPLEEDNNNTDRIIMCTQYILPIFNANVPSNKFVIYYCDQVLPQWNNIEKLENGPSLQQQILRQLAELCAHCGKLESPSVQVVQIFDIMKKFMPPPPEDADLTEVPNLNFSIVECLLYAFHKLARQCPDFLTADANVLKNFRARLNYFSRGVQGCKRSLQNKTTKTNLSKEDEEKLKVAPAILNNINSIIKDLFYQPPVYKCNVTLSFKAVEKERKVNLSNAKEAPVVGQKRHVPITFESSNGNAKQVRGRGHDNFQLYKPPSGKFSNNFHYGSERGRSRGGRMGSRGGRGRGRGWRH